MRFRKLGGFKDDDPIDLDLGGGPNELGVWDTVDKCFVRKNSAGQWVPEAESMSSPTD